MKAGERRPQPTPLEVTAEEPAEEQEQPEEQEEPEEELLQAGTYLVVRYDNKMYVRKFLQINMEDALPYQITFMEQKRKLIYCGDPRVTFILLWPSLPPLGKSWRLFKFAGKLINDWGSHVRMMIVKVL